MRRRSHLRRGEVREMEGRGKKRLKHVSATSIPSLCRIAERSRTHCCRFIGRTRTLCSHRCVGWETREGREEEPSIIYVIGFCNFHPVGGDVVLRLLETCTRKTQQHTQQNTDTHSRLRGTGRRRCFSAALPEETRRQTDRCGEKADDWRKLFILINAGN